MPEPEFPAFPHRGHNVRLERRGNDWAVLLDGTSIDRIPANVEEGPNSDLEALARQVVNSHLEGHTPHGF